MKWLAVACLAVAACKFDPQPLGDDTTDGGVPGNRSIVDNDQADFAQGTATDGVVTE